MLRALAIVEGVGRRLDPGYVATLAAEPHMRRALTRRALPAYWGKRLARSTLSAGQLGLDLPIRIERLLGRLERGEQELGWRPVEFEPVLGELNAMANRVALSVLAAAFVVGVAVLLLSLGPEGRASVIVQALLGLGLLAVLAIGVMLVVSLLRARRG
jgi:ubiquinone biosynthesis protein